MRICERHWKPDDETKTVQGGVKKPTSAPTEFGTTPDSYKQQCAEYILGPKYQFLGPPVMSV